MEEVTHLETNSISCLHVLHPGSKKSCSNPTIGVIGAG